MQHNLHQTGGLQTHKQNQRHREAQRETEHGMAAKQCPTEDMSFEQLYEQGLRREVAAAVTDETESRCRWAWQADWKKH